MEILEKKINIEIHQNKQPSLDEKIKDTIIQYRRDITNFEYKIKDMKKDICILEKKLYDSCSHRFIRDQSAAFDDIFKYKCTKCNLYKNYFR